MSTLFDLRQVCSDINAQVKSLEAKVAQAKNLVEKIRDNDHATAADAARAYFDVKGTYEALDTERKALYHVKDFLDKAIVPGKMEKEGTDKVRIPDLERSFSLQQKTSASFVDKEKGFDWLRELGQGDLIQETVNASTLSAFCRSMVLDEGIDPPDDIVKMTTYNTTGISRYKPKVRV